MRVCLLLWLIIYALTISRHHRYNQPVK
jgi:hypothetical protein